MKKTGATAGPTVNEDGDSCPGTDDATGTELSIMGTVSSRQKVNYAERVRFELTVRFPAHTLSRRAS